MADIFYPDEYLPMPLMDGYGFKPISPLLRTEMTSGRAQQRRRYTHTPASVKWIFKTMLWRRCLRRFSGMRLKMASPRFYLKLQTPVGVKPYKAVRGYLAGRRWSRQNTGSTAQRWNYGNALYRLLAGELPGMAGWPVVTDIALNREWPKHDNS